MPPHPPRPDDPAPPASTAGAATPGGVALRAGAAPEESEARLRAIYDGTVEFIGLLDAGGALLEANRALLEFVGTTREALVGRPFWDTPWFAHTPGAPEAAREAVARAAAGELVRYQARIRHRSGEVRAFDISLHPIRDERGAVTLVVPEGRDVTDLLRTEEALRESERRYRPLFESLEEGFCVIEMLFDDEGRPVDYRFVEANPAFERQTGLHDAVGRRMRELAPAHEAHWFETYGRVATTGEPIRFDARAEALGRWYDVYAFRIGRPEQALVAVLFKDVSAAREAAQERERLLRALEVERARLAYVFQRAPAFLAVVRGPDHVFELVNDAYYQLVGHRPLIGRPAFEALAELREQGFPALLDSVRTTGEPFIGRELPVRLQRAAGAPAEERFLDFAFMPLVEEDGTRTGVIAHGTDVTEHVHARREVERARDRADRLQALTAALAATTTPDEVAEVVVAQGVAATGAASGMLVLRLGDRTPGDPAGNDGGRAAEAVLLRQWGLPGAVAAHYARFPLDVPTPVAASLRTGEAVFLESRAAVLARFPELADVWASMRTEALATIPLAVGGEIVGAMSFTFTQPRPLPAEDRDFFLALGGQAAQALERARLLAAERAARADAEAARLAAERAQRAADEASQAKSAFLATMSHEIRTPINAQIGYAQLLELGVAGPVTEQQRAYLARLTASCEHLRGLVDDVLDLAKVDAGGMVVARTRGWTGALIATALDLVRPQAGTRGVRLVDTRPGEVGEPFVGDEHRVRQILLNLLSNAVKFTEAGGRVVVDCGRQAATPPETALQGGGPWTFVRVSDTGIGIPPEEQGRVFDPFHQVDQRHTRTQGGTGLGLAISRRLARLMGGDLTLASVPGEGSTFTLWLPAAAGDDDRPGQESAGERGARARQEPVHGRVQGLAEVGMHLREHMEEILAAYAARLRADPRFVHAAHLRRSELEDHQLSFLADLAQTLVVIEETGGPDSDLLRDGSTIQRTVAELHGAMRQRRGWTLAQLEHEYDILTEEIVAVVRRRAAEDAAEVAVALDVIGRLVARARAVGVAALQRAVDGADGADGAS